MAACVIAAKLQFMDSKTECKCNRKLPKGSWRILYPSERHLYKPLLNDAALLSWGLCVIPPIYNRYGGYNAGGKIRL